VLHLPNLEEIEALLLEVPALVDRLEEHDPDFVTALKSWLASAENTLSNNRMPAASEIAVCRGSLIAVERGDTDDSVVRGRMGARKYREARASHLLRRATDVINGSISSRRAQVDEAGRVMMQVVAAADRLGLIPVDSGSSHTAYLQGVLQAISNRAEFTSLVVHVTGILGETDCLIVLDRSITSVRQ
jgi:hypothetical protein